jgi:hypothetical protein
MTNQQKAASTTGKDGACLVKFKWLQRQPESRITSL